MTDLFHKWTADCDTVAAISEKLLIEQLLDTMPTELRIWLSEKKPATMREAGKLADDYVLARQRDHKEPGAKQSSSPNQSRQCFVCGKHGHWARNCPQKPPTAGSESGPPGNTHTHAQRDSNPRPQPEKCYNCHKRSHLANRCPSRALYCGTLGGKGRVGGRGSSGVGSGGVGRGHWKGGVAQAGDGPVSSGGGVGGCGSVVGARESEVHREDRGREVVQVAGGKGHEVGSRCVGISTTRTGKVEGGDVHDIVLDTGCSHTMIHQDLIPVDKKIPGEAVTVRCSHGHVTLYPLADVHVQVDGIEFTIRAALSQTLPVSVLLGTDVPDLGRLLTRRSVGTSHSEPAEAMVVTRAQAREQEKSDADQQLREKASAVCPTPITDVRDTREPLMGSTFADDLFSPQQPRTPLTRRQKQLDRHAHGLVRAKDRSKVPGVDTCWSEAVTRRDLGRLQREDKSLQVARSLAEEGTQTPQTFFQEEGLLYRKWIRKGQGEDGSIEQLVLPSQCRQQVLQLAHSVPLGGHLGRKKTFNRIARRFYWPIMHRDVADFCRSCDTCQRFRRHKTVRVPLVPLPVIEEPFSRIAMDIVGPLPRSRGGNRYVLVVCDYGTKYPEAVPLRSIDAETVAEELMVIFSRVGIPREILTDQGSNFQSQLLRELYRLLHIDALRTSPYHPQMDGLVERFNQTLKGMLRKTAAQEGKDWDRLIPALLFAYREVPQKSTDFSPFELLYGRDVRGPLDILKESRVAGKRSDPNVAAYVLMMRDRLETMSMEARKNKETAKIQQKTWYDKGARERSFQPGDQVLVLLPTTAAKLTAQWQGPYTVVEQVGKVNYKLKMPDRRKKTAIFHVNMLQK